MTSDGPCQRGARAPRRRLTVENEVAAGPCQRGARAPRRQPTVENEVAAGVLRTALGWPGIPLLFLSGISLSHKSKLVSRIPSSTASSARRGVLLRNFF